MIGVRKAQSLTRTVKFTSSAAVFGGTVFGAVAALLLAVQSSGRVPYYLWLIPTSMGGVSGYLWWLTSEKARAERFWRVVSLAALIAIALLVFAYPESSWPIVRAGGVLLAILLLGVICAASMFVVGTGWGLVHLLGHLSYQLRFDRKPNMARASGGVWDREID